MTAESSTYRYDGITQETVTLKRGPGTPPGHALLKIAYNLGAAADCYVNTAWLRDRANDLDPRPLTPDAITDEMVERAAERYRGLPTAMRATDRARVMLRAALTEPPARPEGAERFDPVVDAAIRGYSDITSPDVVRAISDAIAEEMNR